jgi:rubrerythrin
MKESSSEIPNTCGDAVSRQAVEKITWEEPTFTDALNVLAEVRDKVRALPSVSPQQRTGRWVKDGQGGRYKWMCSNCGTHQRALYDYCPSCGTRMAESEDKE